ncbi:MAG TPA: SGNH/GDSL hydrolase family protein [Anaerolineae bacterium]
MSYSQHSLPRSLLILLLSIFLSACMASSNTATPVPSATSAPRAGSFDSASVSGISLNDIAVLPAVSARMKALYQAGIAQGNNPNVFAKLGDCMTENPYFLGPISEGKYELGEYTNLKPVIEQFAGHPTRGASAQGGWQKDSFATIGLASAGGFNVAAPLDSTWADPKWCQSGESPLACEYRISRPSIAIIMFGTNDVNYTDAATYDFYLRTIVSETLNRRIVPILNTFPTRPEDRQKSLLLNQIAVRVARDFDIPLVNLNRALEQLPNRGVNPEDSTHLSIPEDKRVDIFTADHLTAGFTMRNLVTLQSLQAVLEAVR